MVDKIYSRRRISFFIGSIKQKIYKNRKRTKLFKVITILIIAMLTMRMILESITPIFNKLCEAEAKSIATTISNNKATEVMKGYEYEDLFTVMKDNNGNITAIQTNIIPINEIISSVAVEIQTELDKLEYKNIGIRLGTFTGSKLLSGRGPNVNMRISSVGDVETDFKSEFQEAGINQTLHRLYLEVKCNVSILTPFDTIEREIINQVILAENIIVGITPNTYYNFHGMNDTQNALEIIE